MNEFEYEEIRGLPGKLPHGETVLWQGAPDWRALARRTFHVPTIAVYFAALVVIRAVFAIVLDDASLLAAIASALYVVPIALLGLGLLIGLAVWHARTTVYTITNKRVVLRYGIAVQLAINLPFREITGASFMRLPHGFGEIPLTLGSTGRIAYLHLWPHARPGLLRNPEPMLRCVADADTVAEILTTAWSEDTARRSTSTVAPPAIEPPPSASLHAAAGVAG